MFITHGEHAARDPACRCRTAWRSSSSPGYTECEKLDIAKQYLVPKQREANGLEEPNIDVHRRRRCIDDHPPLHAAKPACGTSSARSRRSAARSRARSSKRGAPTQTLATSRRRTCRSYLGVAEVPLRPAPRSDDEIGVANGLAVHRGRRRAARRPRSRSCPARASSMITGQLGEVMQESAQAAMSYVRSRAEAARARRATSTRRSTSTSTSPRARSRRTGRRRASRWRPRSRRALHAHPGARERRDDRRDHAARPRAADRRAQGEDPRGAPRRHRHRAHPEGEREGPRTRSRAACSSAICGSCWSSTWTRCSPTRSCSTDPATFLREGDHAIDDIFEVPPPPKPPGEGIPSPAGVN